MMLAVEGKEDGGAEEGMVRDVGCVVYVVVNGGAELAVAVAGRGVIVVVGVGRRHGCRLYVGSFSDDIGMSPRPTRGSDATTRTTLSFVFPPYFLSQPTHPTCRRHATCRRMSPTFLCSLTYRPSVEHLFTYPAAPLLHRHRSALPTIPIQRN